MLRMFWVGALALMVGACAARRSAPNAEEQGPGTALVPAQGPGLRVDSADYMPGMPSPAAPGSVRPTAPAAPAPVPGIPPAVTREFPGTWIPLNRWARSQGLPSPVRVDNGPSPAYLVDAPQGVFKARAGSTLASWDGLEVRLGHSPQIIDGQPYLHALDISKTVWPLVHGAGKPVLQARPRIVIDPGHGGEDSGTRSVIDSRPEKDFVLDWALRLRDLLTASGWEVYLTRTLDMELSLSNRVAFSERLKADLFVSLHFNSTGAGQSEAGLETYCLTPAGLPSSLTRGYDDDLTQTFPNNAFDAENLHLGVEVHRALLKLNGSPDRGLRRARFLGVLRGQQRPAILVEGGYLSNPAEARQIADPAHRQKLAEAVAQGLRTMQAGLNGSSRAGAQRAQ